MGFWIYMLKCADGTYYSGHTDDLEKRFAEHQSGFFRGYTAGRLPVEIVFAEEFQTRDEALQAEQQIKGWSRAKKAALVDGNWDRVSQLARSRQRMRIDD